MENIQKSAIKKLVVLDTIYLPQERLIDKIEQISLLLIFFQKQLFVSMKNVPFSLFEIGKINIIKVLQYYTFLEMFPWPIR